MKPLRSDDYSSEMSLSGPGGIIAFGLLLLIAAAVQSKSIPTLGVVDWEKYRNRVMVIGALFVTGGLVWAAASYFINRPPAEEGIRIDYLIGPPVNDVLGGLDALPPDFAPYLVVADAGDWTAVEEQLLEDRLGPAGGQASRCSDGDCNRTLYLAIFNDRDTAIRQPTISWYVEQFSDPLAATYRQVDDPKPNADALTMADIMPADGRLIPLATVIINATSRTSSGVGPPLNAVGDVRYPVTLSFSGETSSTLDVRPVSDQFAIRTDNMEWYGVGG